MRAQVLAATLLLSLTASAGRTAEAPIFTEGGLALSGHDPVAYFEHGHPVRGDPRFQHVWQGATWQFATEAHLARFKADPGAFAPRYGGYCAWAVSQGCTAPADPAAWRIVDGKLYLNYDLDVQRTWEKDVPGHIEQADANWPKVLDE